MANGKSGGNLAGRAILVTRPAPQAAPLAERIAARGGRAVVFPLLHIEPIVDRSEFEAALDRLAGCDFAAFVSPNAVAASLPAILQRGPWPAGLRAVAVGAGTARALAALGVGPVIVPAERFDSESLLEMPELAPDAVGGRRFVIFRGDGGRELLADSLRTRGAHVDCVTCYRRLPPGDFAPLDAELGRGGIDAISVTSSEALRHLVDGVAVEQRPRLLALPFFTSHTRIADNAARAGFATVILTGVGDDALVESLCAYNWSARNAVR